MDALRVGGGAATETLEGSGAARPRDTLTLRPTAALAVGIAAPMRLHPASTAGAVEQGA